MPSLGEAEGIHSICAGARQVDQAPFSSGKRLNLSSSLWFWFWLCHEARGLLFP